MIEPEAHPALRGVLAGIRHQIIHNHTHHLGVKPYVIVSLALVYNLVKLHHGEIFVDSEPHRGSVFRFRIHSENCYPEASRREESVLPAAELAATQDITVEAEPEAKPSILVVEDNVDINLGVKPYVIVTRLYVGIYNQVGISVQGRISVAKLTYHTRKVGPLINIYKKRIKLEYDLTLERRNTRRQQELTAERMRFFTNTLTANLYVPDGRLPRITLLPSVLGYQSLPRPSTR